MTQQQIKNTSFKTRNMYKMGLFKKATLAALSRYLIHVHITYEHFKFLELMNA